MNEGEKYETISGKRLHGFTSAMIEQLEQPQLIRFCQGRKLLGGQEGRKNVTSTRFYVKSTVNEGEQFIGL